MKAVPDSLSDLTSSSPSCLFTIMSYEILKPIPVPFHTSLVVKKGSILISFLISLIALRSGMASE